VVVCLNTLLNLRSLDVVSVALGEMTRVSRGYVLVDIRNGDNPLLRFRYWRHRRRATFPTVGYRLQDMKEIFRHNGFPVEQVFPIGVDHPWLALGYVIAARRKDM
jgi:hypothetical protein